VVLFFIFWHKDEMTTIKSSYKKEDGVQTPVTDLTISTFLLVEPEFVH